MQPKDIFKLAVRLLGLVFLYHGLQALPAALGLIFGSFPHDVGHGMRSSWSFTGFVSGVFIIGWPLVVAFWLWDGAAIIVRTAYPDAPASTEDETKAGAAIEH